MYRDTPVRLTFCARSPRVKRTCYRIRRNAYRPHTPDKIRAPIEAGCTPQKGWSVDEVAFGRYRLVALIGEGGMGKVYKAHDTVMDRDVALKVLPAELASEPGYEQRFRREALVAGRLTEPHVIPVHEAGEIDGRLFLTMPIINGTDLHTVLDSGGPLTPRRAVSVVEQLAAALDAAHAAGLVHRDVKPSNALLTGDDFVYLIDFGIAHDAGGTKLTQTGLMVGTVAYMSPERLNSGAVDARSDVYALACVLYECLTGAQPFGGDSVEQQLVGHLTLDPPKPSHLDPEIPTGFDEVIATGMAKDPDRRYQSAKELVTAARQALTAASDPARGADTSKPSRDKSTQPHPQPPPPPSDPLLRPLTDTPPAAGRPSRKWLIAAAVVLLVVGAGAALAMRNMLSPKPTTELVLTAATDPGANPFMPPAAGPPPTNTQPPPILAPHGNGPVVTQPLPGDRDGLYGGTMNNAECDRDKMVTFLSSHPTQASAFVDALNTDPTLSWSGGHALTASDIPTYLRELTPTIVRVDTRVTNHGFDGTHPTTLQSVFQPGTGVFVDTHGVPRARCYCGNPLTAPSALTGEPKPVGTPWAGYNPDALAAVQPSKAAITTFVLVDVITGKAFNRPAGTTGASDTPHTGPVAPPEGAPTMPTSTQAPQLDIDGTYLVHPLTATAPCAVPPDFSASFTHQGNTLTMVAGALSWTGPLNADGSFTLSGSAGRITGVFGADSGRTVIRDGVSQHPAGHCGPTTFVATKQ